MEKVNGFLLVLVILGVVFGFLRWNKSRDRRERAREPDRAPPAAAVAVAVGPAPVPVPAPAARVARNEPAAGSSKWVLGIGLAIIVLYLFWSGAGKNMWEGATHPATIPVTMHPISDGPVVSAASAAEATPAPVSALPEPSSVFVPPHQEGDEGFSDPVPVVKFTTLCYEKAPEAAGFDRQFHDFRYDDIKEKEHWHWWPTDPTVIVYDNADRFRSTDANGFYLKYFYVHQGSKCFP